MTLLTTAYNTTKRFQVSKLKDSLLMNSKMNWSGSHTSQGALNSITAKCLNYAANRNSCQQPSFMYHTWKMISNSSDIPLKKRWVEAKMAVSGAKNASVDEIWGWCLWVCRKLQTLACIQGTLQRRMMPKTRTHLSNVFGRLVFRLSWLRYAFKSHKSPIFKTPGSFSPKFPWWILLVSV